MKRVTTASIALAAMLAMTALIGATSASATVLCKENTSTCSESNIYPSGTSVAASLTGEFKLTGVLTLSCTGSALGGKTKADKGSPLPIELTSFTISGCSGGGGCPGVVSAETLSGPYTAGMTKTTEGDGTVVLSSGGAGAPRVKFNCGTIYSCTYSLDGAQLGFDGGSPAALALSSTVSRVEGFGAFCGEKATLSASYKVTGPNPAYATVGAGVGNSLFCKEGGSVCPSNGAAYPSGTVVEGKATNVYFKTGFNGLHCDSTVSFKSTAKEGNPLPIEPASLSFSNCSGGVNCTSAKLQTLYSGWYANATASGNGEIGVSFDLELECGGSKCSYLSGPASKGSFTGGSSPTLAWNEFPFYKFKGVGFCPTYISLYEVNYKISSPTPLYLSKAES